MNDKTTLRKAAILLASLDPHSSDGLLRQMDAAQAQELRQAVAGLGPIDPLERQRVIDEFVRNGGAVPQERGADPGVELDASLREKIAEPPRSASIKPRQASWDSPATMAATTAISSRAGAAHEKTGLRFLQHTDSADLAEALGDEHPQAIALVLSHLPGERAAAVLAELPGGTQSEVMRRMLDQDEAHPEVLHEVARGLQSRLAQQARRPQRRHAGVTVLAGILDAADDRSRQQILANLERHDRQLASLLAPPPQPQWEDIDELDDHDLVQVLREADPQVAVLALAGSSPTLVNRLLAMFPPLAAQSLRQALQYLGPTPLSDLDRARQEMLLLARRMSATGRLKSPDRPLLNAAA